VVSSDFSWNDVGSWNALYDVLRHDKKGNVVRGHGKVLGGQNNFIQSNGRFTAVLGASDMVVINTDDATLVVPRDQVEDVKALVEFLKKNKKDHLI
jgi:mannose-1-phosphate guanylyltransferase